MEETDLKKVSKDTIYPFTGSAVRWTVMVVGAGNLPYAGWTGLFVQEKLRTDT